MKICWDNLEKVYLTKKNNLKHLNGHLYFEKICKCCNEIFLGKKDSEFCSNRCSRLSMKKETLEKLRIACIGTKKYWKGGISVTNLVWYDTYAHQISWCEEVRRAPDDENILEVKCKYCGKWYKPDNGQVRNRIKALNNLNKGENGLYCSEKCKQICPVFKRLFNPIGFTGEQNSSNEVQPELRKLVLERDDYTCQKCGLNSNEQCVELHCHHINPVKLDPIESADIDNCITLCVDCHHEAHQKDGCSTGFLANCVNI